jgi:hypothetical protein
MIQFNLLPDIKLEYIKARRSKRMVLLTSVAVTGVSLFIFASLFFVVNVLQTKHISDLNGDIKKYTVTLKAVPDLDKVLTVQNQLQNLTSLHDQKPVSSRLYDYLGQVTPAQVTISSAQADFTTHTLSLVGNADAISTVNKYVDTLKFTEFSVAGQGGTKKAFSQVVLGGFSSGDKTATYQISLNFDPDIFDGTKQVTLVVPKITSTRSETEKPGDLFQQSTNTTKQ